MSVEFSKLNFTDVGKDGSRLSVGFTELTVSKSIVAAEVSKSWKSPICLI